MNGVAGVFDVLADAVDRVTATGRGNQDGGGEESENNALDGFHNQRLGEAG